MFHLARPSHPLFASIALALLTAGCGTDMPQQLLSAGPGGAAGTNRADDPVVIEDELVLIAKTGAEADAINELVAENGATVRATESTGDLYLIGVDAAKRKITQTALARSSLVEAVTDNLRYEATATPDDSRFNRQWHLTTIGAAGAWDVTVGDPEVIVAVLDTGVDGGHPDLIPNLLEGWNAFNNNTDTTDPHGHGTKVAGVIAAAGNNGLGVASVAWDCGILPVRIADADGLTTSYAITAGMRWAVAREAEVINISFAPLYWDTLVARQARLARLAGTVVVIATGNNGITSEAPGSDEILFVGATDRTDQLASFSNNGDFVDLVAPGVDIYTTMRNGRYGPWSGTSFAAPIVSGVAALIFSVNPALRPVTVETILNATVADLGEPGWDPFHGAGRINAEWALLVARDARESLDEVPPTAVIVSPSSGSSVSGWTVVEVRASDAGGVADVLLSIDGVTVGSDPLSPHEFFVDPARYAAGTHTIAAVAIDSHGNASDPAEITLVFGGAVDRSGPSVSITQPPNNSTVSTAVLTIIAETSDDRGLALYEVLINDEVVQTTPLVDADQELRVAYNWNTSVAPGSYTVAVRVTDTSGNVATSSVRVSVE